jgi:hypothetical protein
VGVAATDEAPEDLGLGDVPAERAEEPRLHPHGEALAVHQHAVAVEDDEVDRLAGGGRQRSRTAHAPRR